MDDYELEPSRLDPDFQNTLRFARENQPSESIQTRFAKVLFGNDYTPLDDHDYAALIQLSLIVIVGALLLTTLAYKYHQSRKASERQRNRLSAVMREERLRAVNGHSKQKKSE